MNCENLGVVFQYTITKYSELEKTNDEMVFIKKISDEIQSVSET